MTMTLLMALVPIALLIGLGAWLHHSGFLNDGFWSQAERLGYYILLPSLFLHGLATARMEGVPVAGMAGALVSSTLLVALLLVVLRRHLPVNDAAFTSVFQGGVRFNNYVGVSAAAGLLGPQGVVLAAVANAVAVPTVNVLCVLVFARYGAGTPSLAGVLRQLVRNPLLMSCLGGILLQLSGIGMPAAVAPVLKTLGQASLPLGLLCVGAALDFSAARRWLKPVGIASLAKLGLMPVATVLACRAFDLHGAGALTALVFQALPTASSSYIMARQMGGDAPLMAGIIACQTVLAGLVFPLSVMGLVGWV